jgi:predicted Zn-dependent peptidase
VHAAEVVKLMREQLADVATNGVTADELAIAQGYLRGAFVLGLEDTASRMSRLAGHVTARGEVRPVADQLARYNAVTLADTRRVANRVLAQPLSFAAVGPLSKKATRELCGL